VWETRRRVFQAAVGAFLASTAASRSTASVVGGRCALAHKRGTTERFAWPYVDVVIEKAAAARCRNRLLISPSKRSVVGVVEEMVKQKLVTLIVPSLVLDEFRRLGWIYPSRFLGTYREDAGASRRLLLYTENFLL
jgi:hypothetical protein